MPEDTKSGNIAIVLSSIAPTSSPIAQFNIYDGIIILKNIALHWGLWVWGPLDL